LLLWSSESTFASSKDKRSYETGKRRRLLNEMLREKHPSFFTYLQQILARTNWYLKQHHYDGARLTEVRSFRLRSFELVLWQRELVQEGTPACGG
jgi:hypothetical protein